MSVQPFRVEIAQEQIDLLKGKLELAVFPNELENANWDYGMPLADVKRLMTYWKNEFDWRRAEAQLNLLPQFISPIEVEGFGRLEMHFVHQRSKVQGAIPLLFVHGWPGSFIEVSKILPQLVNPTSSAAPAFHVVAPSLPGFAFSEAPKKRGFGGAQYAEACHKVMLALGYEEYVTQGGDWGFHVTRHIGQRYPLHCKASHINMIRAQPPTFLSHPYLWMKSMLPYSQTEKKGFERTKWFTKVGYGYNLEQSTKPQTLGYGLVDSPVGLLAWIGEKLHDWTDAYPWTDDEVLTWISLYCFSKGTPASSLRIYYEVRNEAHDVLSYVPNVKLGMSFFPQELAVLPFSWGATLGPTVFQRRHPRGGHFAAWEMPDTLVEDLRDMFGRKGGAFGVIKHRSGYDPVAKL